MLKMIGRTLCGLAVSGMLAGSASAGCGYGYSYYPSYSSYPTYVEHKTIINRNVIFDLTPPIAVGYFPIAAATVAVGAPVAAPPAPASLPAAAPPAPAPAVLPCEARLAETNARLAAMEAKFNAFVAASQSGGSGGNPLPPAPPPSPPLESAPRPSAVPPAGAPVPSTPRQPRKASGAALIANCAKCHDESNAKSKGGDLALTRGAVFSGSEIKGGEPTRIDDKTLGACIRKMLIGDMPPDHNLPLETMNAVMNDLMDAVTRK